MSSSSSKRSRRLSQSSSQGEVSTLTPTDSPMISWRGKKRATEAESSVKNAVETANLNTSIWTLDDGDLSGEEADQFRIHERIGASWWKTCANCKKNIHNEMNIYMYGFLQAFCSVECRDAKILVNDIFGRSPQQPTTSTPRKAGRRPEGARYK